MTLEQLAAQPLGLAGGDVEDRVLVAAAHVALADLGQLDDAPILVEQPRGAREGDELACAAERVLEPGREQILDGELGDELVEADAVALVDGAQQAVGVAKAGRRDRTHGGNLNGDGPRGPVQNVSVRPCSGPHAEQGLLVGGDRVGLGRLGSGLGLGLLGRLGSRLSGGLRRLGGRLEAAGLEAAGFDAAGALAFAAGLAAEVAGFAAAFGFAAALGFAAAFGFAAGLATVGASAAAFDAAEAGFPAAFGFALGAAVPVGFAVADFGPPFAPALGAGFRFFAAGLRVAAPGLAARAVRVVPGVEAPVLLPPARVPAEVSEV